MTAVAKEELSYGNVILDYKTPAVVNKDSGESIKINNKEFQLLEYFMMNHSQVLSKEMIFDRVWGMDSDTLSNNLEAYLSFVRKKLKAVDANVTIKSLRNMGYRMETLDEGTK
jgi:DNA-binding response OmpR family regulator